jgi:hypothetical protein
MRWRQTRRGFLSTAATAGAIVGAGPWANSLSLSLAGAEASQVTPDLVRFSPDIEPLVRLIEETPRDKCVEVFCEQLRRGLPYRVFLAALYLANIRTSEVDHPLAVLHSAHELSLDLPVQERLLPLFVALDSFKVHRPGNDRGSGLKPLTGNLPAAEHAEAELHAAMRAFDRERAERAVVALWRHHGMARVAEPLWHYGARDWTFIGHFAIWAANCWRPLPVIGWQQAEPILRVVTTSLVGEDQMLRGQPYAANCEHVAKAKTTLPADWADSVPDVGLTKELLSLIRERRTDEACQLAARQLSEGKAKAGAIWDAIHLAAGEMILCAQKNSEPLHANTAANALHYAFRASGDAGNRLLILLQAVGWMCLYRSALARKGWLKEAKQLTEIEAVDLPQREDAAVEDILSQLSFGAGNPPTPDAIPGWKGAQFNHQPWRYQAACKVFAFARRFSDSQRLVREAFRLLPRKADWDPHRIKFPLAACENVDWVSSEWRPHLLAAASCSFLGADALDTDLAQQVREALRGL